MNGTAALNLSKIFNSNSRNELPAMPAHDASSEGDPPSTSSLSLTPAVPLASEAAALSNRFVSQQPAASPIPTSSAQIVLVSSGPGSDSPSRGELPRDHAAGPQDGTLRHKTRRVRKVPEQPNQHVAPTEDRKNIQPPSTLPPKPDKLKAGVPHAPSGRGVVESQGNIMPAKECVFMLENYFITHTRQKLNEENWPAVSLGLSRVVDRLNGERPKCLSTVEGSRPHPDLLAAGQKFFDKFMAGRGKE